MDIGKILNNHDFYKGYEGEPLIILSIEGCNENCLYVWEGYFEDIFGNAEFSDNGWIGFTKDYQQLEGPFSGDNKPHIIDTIEYIQDLKKYLNKKFNYEETMDLLNLLIDFLDYAILINKRVLVSFD